MTLGSFVSILGFAGIAAICLLRCISMRQHGVACDSFDLGIGMLAAVAAIVCYVAA